jgi:hypothetical protein
LDQKVTVFPLRCIDKESTNTTSPSLELVTLIQLAEYAISEIKINKNNNLFISWASFRQLLNIRPNSYKV